MEGALKFARAATQRDVEEALTEYGEKVGVAFQLKLDTTQVEGHLHISELNVEVEQADARAARARKPSCASCRSLPPAARTDERRAAGGRGTQGRNVPRGREPLAHVDAPRVARAGPERPRGARGDRIPVLIPFLRRGVRPVRAGAGKVQ